MKDPQPQQEDKQTAFKVQDKEFAERICQEYRLPSEAITSLIGKVREYIYDDFSSDFEDSRLRETFNLLFSQGSEIKSITIRTGKGSVEVKPHDRVYEEYFRKPLKRMKSDFRETLNTEVNFLTAISWKSAFAMIVYYFEVTPLNKMQRNCAIFDFIQYFNIGDPLMTLDQWNKDPTEDQDHRHYKDTRIKSRKKRYLRDPNDPR